jgi:hypothetical protein
LRDSSGNPVPNAFADDGGVGFDSRFTYTAANGGTFFLAAGAGNHNNGTGTYTMLAADISKPDLHANNLTLSNSSITAGDSITVSYLVSNIDNGTAGNSTAGIYLSTDPSITTSDTLLTTRLSSSIASGFNASDSFSLTLSTPGTYYIGVIADYSNQIGESIETNNASNAVQITVTAPVTKPDLTASLNGVSSSSLSSGGSFTANYTLSNSGSASAGNFLATFYLSPDPTFNDGNDIALNLVSVSGLTAGGSTSGTMQLSIPSAFGAGTYYLGLIADKGGGFQNGQIDESNENNNVSNNLQVNVAAPPANVTIATSVPTTTEGNGNPIIFLVNLDRITSQDLTVNFQVGGTANTSDYVIKSGSQVITNSIIVPAGSLNAAISIYANTDVFPEGDESVSVQLTGVSAGVQLGSALIATGTIHDTTSGRDRYCSGRPRHVQFACGQRYGGRCDQR